MRIFKYIYIERDYVRNRLCQKATTFLGKFKHFFNTVFFAFKKHEKSNYGEHRMKGVFTVKAKLSEAKFVYLTHFTEYCPRTQSLQITNIKQYKV